MYHEDLHGVQFAAVLVRQLLQGVHGGATTLHRRARRVGHHSVDGAGWQGAAGQAAAPCGLQASVGRAADHHQVPEGHRRLARYRRGRQVTRGLNGNARTTVSRNKGDGPQLMLRYYLGAAAALYHSAYRYGTPDKDLKVHKH